MLPVHHQDTGNWGLPNPVLAGNSTGFAHVESKHEIEASDRMLWLYVFFVYLFSALALSLIVTETKKIIRIRQDYLGSQTTITDRTIRLSGIPAELRSEELIKETIENLDIGKVEKVLLCRDWSEVDHLWSRRAATLRRLENAWIQYNSQKSDGDEEAACRHLDRPLTRIWHGMQPRQVDAIEHFEEQLQSLDKDLTASRKKIFQPTPLALVTLDSIASAVSYSWFFQH